MKFLKQLGGLLKSSSEEIRRRLIVIFVALIFLNIFVWILGLFFSRMHPLLLGLLAIAYGLGLRHAIDADHIAAIDNTTRKLMQMKQRPVSVGFFFAMGHSLVIRSEE